MSAKLEDLRKDIRMRLETDSVMSSAWLLIYIAPIVSGVLMVLSIVLLPVLLPAIGAAAMALLWMIIGILSVISFIISIVLVYKLVKRRNTHFKRQIFLYEDTISLLREVAIKRKVNVDVELASCERTLRETKAEETEKSAALWAILSAIIFIATWYVYYFLMKDFYKHERREGAFFEDVGRTFSKCGITFTLPRRFRPIPDRSFVLYLVMTIITLGIFGIYWLYILLSDPNEHFKYHVGLEEDLLKVFESGIL